MEDGLISLDEAAKICGGTVTAETLKGRAREGKLQVYRVGRRYATTRADLTAMIELCRVVRKVPTPPDPDTSLAHRALVATFAKLDAEEQAKRAERKRLKEEERIRTEPERRQQAKLRRSARSKARYQEQKRARLEKSSD
jgi:hypothetical protein